MSMSKVYPVATAIEQLLHASEEAAACLCRQPEDSDERQHGDALRVALAGLGVRVAGAMPAEKEPGPFDHAAAGTPKAIVWAVIGWVIASRAGRDKVYQALEVLGASPDQRIRDVIDQCILPSVEDGLNAWDAFASVFS